MSLELFIAWRYLKARRKGVFTLLTTLIAVGGITLGVAALIITLSVMSGFHRDIREKILGLQPHLVVVKQSGEPFVEYRDVARTVRGRKHVTAVAPFVYGQIILRHGHATTGAVVKGIDYSRERKLVDLERGLVKGKVGESLGERDIIIGRELASILGVAPGDSVILVSPGEAGFVPRMDRFTVTAVFNSGMYEYDATLAYVSLPAAQRLFDMDNAVTGLGIALDRWERASEVEAELQNDLSYPYWVRSWQQMNRSLFAALKLEKIMMFIILGLIILVASFNVISNLILLTVEKSKEIGVLSAIGLKRGRIARVFFYEGLIIGSGGILLGLITGTGISLLLSRYQFIHLPADVYYLDTLPVRLVAGDIVSVVAAALLITVAASIYPAYQVSKLNPLDAIRYG